MSDTKQPFLSNRAYDVLKFIAQILLPALGALYFGLAQIWGLPKAEEVVGTITVVDTFLGVLLGLSSKQYNNSDVRYDGAFDVEEVAPNRHIYTLELDPETEENLHDMDHVIFKIKRK
jgi:hypothetical protein